MSEQRPNSNPPEVPPLPEINQQIQEGQQAELAEAQLKSQLASAERKVLELEREKQELQEKIEVHGIRKEYIEKLYGLTVVWLTFVILFIILQATSKGHFNLNDGVLIAFITSTTVAVIGIFLIVAKWLFPTLQKESSKQE
jgi:hypothetical protein